MAITCGNVIENFIAGIKEGEGPLEEGMVIHSGILARKIPLTEKPGGLQSMGSQRVRHD